MEIQDYPVAVPISTDRIPYVSDPAGSPSLKLTAVSSLPSGGSGTSDQTKVTYAGTTMTGTAVSAGTWAATTDFAQTDTANAAHDLRLGDAITYSPFHATIETELKFATGAAFTGISTLNGTSFLTNTPCVALRDNTLYMIAAGSGLLATISVTAAADTWHTLRVVASGRVWTAYLNDARIVTYDFSGVVLTADGFSLYSQGTTSHFRNASIWYR